MLVPLSLYAFFHQVGPPVDSLPPYSPQSVQITTGSPLQGLVTQGDRLNQLKRDRTQYKTATAGTARSVGHSQVHHLH